MRRLTPIQFEKGKAEAIQKSQESFLDSSLLNGNLTSEMNGFNEKSVGNDRSMINSNEYKMKKEEKMSPVQMQRKHSPTLCALGYSFKMSMNTVPNGSEMLDMSERRYCDKNMFYEKILFENGCVNASCEYIFDILEAAKPSTPHETTANIFYGEKHAQTAAQLKCLELQQVMCSRQNYGCDSHEMDANQKKKRGEMLYIASNSCTLCRCSISF